MHPRRSVLYFALCCTILLALITSISAAPDRNDRFPEPSVYLNINEGGGLFAFDLSGNGNSGELHGATRIKEGACGQALFFNGVDSFVTLPFRTNNHPEQAITVDLWFSVDSYDRQVLISTFNNGGYRFAFDDGNDLWWTVSTARGDISVPVRHESIPLHRWHHLAGTYDGKTSRIYLDGTLMNIANGSGPISYTSHNNVVLGADAGTGDKPDPQCNGYFKGGLDEIRIYDRALTNGQIMDDRFSCPEEPRVPEFTASNRSMPASCSGLTGRMTLRGGEEVIHRIIATSPDENADISVQVPPGSTLDIRVIDKYSVFYPDSWYIEISERGNRLTRSVAFPNTINAPAEAAVQSGNATVRIRYFDGFNRFPASALVILRCVAPPPPPPEPPRQMVINPIIVIYTASWATLIALILVFYWLHKRSKNTDKAG